MSWKGIHKVAAILTEMQQARSELISMGSKGKALGTKEGNQDIRLGQMLEKAKDSIKWDFAKITLEPTRRIKWKQSTR
jgi:hypothetical protein